MLVLALALALTLTSAGEPKTTQAAAPGAPAPEYAMTVDPEGPITLCLGERAGFQVDVVLGRRRTPTSPLTIAHQANELILASGAGGIGDLTPTQLNTVRHGLRAYGTFSFTAKKVGRTTLTFSHEYLVPLTGGPSNGAPDVQVPVEVKLCDFIVFALSRWHIRDGFQPFMTSTLLQIVHPNPDGNFDVKAPVKNSATGVTIGGCSPIFIIGDTDAVIEGRWNRDGKLDMTLTYQPVAVATQVRCPGIGGGRPRDLGTPLQLRADTVILSLGGAGGGFYQTQVLEAYVRVTGRTFIAVVPIGR